MIIIILRPYQINGNACVLNAFYLIILITFSDNWHIRRTSNNSCIYNHL